MAKRTAGRWGKWLTALAGILCFGAVATALVGAFGSGQEWWHFRFGFTLLTYAFYVACAGVVLALIALIVVRKAKGRVVTNLLAILAAGGFIVFLGLQVRTARSVPAIHDVATNLDDLPQFSRLPVRLDNLENIPDMDRPELAALPREQRWKAIHREAYGDLRTIRVPGTVAEAIGRAETLARERGWEVAVADPEAGRLEATDTTLFFRFKDDVVIRARPAAEGGGTEVDMRSISRVGGSDVGVNAKRVRSFLADLQQAR